VSLEETITQHLTGLRLRIEAACCRAGRSSSDVTLVCVSKFVSLDAIRAAYQAGARDFGENYGQDLRDKAAALADLDEIRWHFIGGLQRNKVKYVAGRTQLIHSVDSEELLDEIHRRAEAEGKVQEVLIQLNLAGEETKSGIREDQLPGILDTVASCPACRCVGLMTMPPFFDDPEACRPLFARLRALREHHGSPQRPGVELRHLSMGMSGDFEVAIEEGATLIRVGTAIFGDR